MPLPTGGEGGRGAPRRQGRPRPPALGSGRLGAAPPPVVPPLGQQSRHRSGARPASPRDGANPPAPAPAPKGRARPARRRGGAEPSRRAPPPRPRLGASSAPRVSRSPSLPVAVKLGRWYKGRQDGENSAFRDFPEAVWGCYSMLFLREDNMLAVEHAPCIYAVSDFEGDMKKEWETRYGKY